MDTIDQLLKQLKAAREAYYTKGTPLMSDSDFDALEEKLRILSPSHEYFSSVGHLSGGGNAIRHTIPMLSMDKAKDISGVERWLSRLKIQPETTPLCIQPKIDGISAALRYSGGQLKTMATRGDGQAGLDISHVASRAQGIPDTCAFSKEHLEVRGELYLPKDTDFDTGERPLRNNCSGLINRKERLEDLSYVHFLAYQIVWPASGGTSVPAEIADLDSRFNSENGKIEILSEGGFSTFLPWKIHSSEEIGTVYSQYLERLRAEWNFETDGLVIVVDDNRLHEGIDRRWTVDHHHHYALALKPPSETAETIIRDVAWQVSRLGALIPVAVFDTVPVGGAQLTRASLHNVVNLRRLNFLPEDRILIERANDVIPYVRENLSARNRSAEQTSTEFEPKECPSCGTNLQEEGVHLLCPNMDCRGRAVQSILFWVKQSGFKHISAASIESLYEAGRLRTTHDLYTLTEKDFENIPGFGTKKIANFLEQVESSRRMSAPDFIARLGIPSVQKKSLDLNRLNIQTLDDFRRFESTEYAAGREIVAWKSNPRFMELFEKLADVLEIFTAEPISTSKGTVCLTGTAPLPRKDFSSLLEQNGWAVSSSVTKNTALVLSEPPDGDSSKLQKARSLDIAVLSYEDFLSREKIHLK